MRVNGQETGPSQAYNENEDVEFGLLEGRNTSMKQEGATGGGQLDNRRKTSQDAAKDTFRRA